MVAMTYAKKSTTFIALKNQVIVTSILVEMASYWTRFATQESKKNVLKIVQIHILAIHVYLIQRINQFAHSNVSIRPYMGLQQVGLIVLDKSDDLLVEIRLYQLMKFVMKGKSLSGVKMDVNQFLKAGIVSPKLTLHQIALKFVEMVF